MSYHSQNTRPLSWLFLLLMFIAFVFNAEAQELSEEDINWQQLATTYTIIYHQSDDDLLTFDNKLRFGQKHWGIKRLFSDTDDNDLRNRLTKKVDTIFERVQEVLDMKKKMPKVIIHLYSSKKQMHDVYFSIYQETCQIRAWYRYKNNTMYLAVSDLHEGIVAHELAHAIIDHYLLVRPPAASAEILARYVDSHLKP